MAKKMIVFGAGIVGSAIAVDLKKSGYDVCSVDLNEKALQKLSQEHDMDTECVDFTNADN
jgi:Trk K+ transport system NAD-binding subunit